MGNFGRGKKRMKGLWVKEKFMFSRQVPMVCLVSAALLLTVPSVAQQEGVDREAYARERVQFLVLQLDQWSKDFPHQFYASLMKMDASKLSEGTKAGADDLGASVKQLYSLSNAKDVLKSDQFKGQLDKTIAAAKQVNQAMSAQRFPDPLQTDWEQMRTNLNSLASIYKVETLAILEPPAAGGGRGGRGGKGGETVAKTVAPGAGVTGYIVDQSCALKGKGMWINATCIERCVRDGDSVVIVTEEGKVFRISNPDKITSDTYGQKVTLLGKTEADVIVVSGLQ
jgi:hypothetical protein